MKRKSIDLDITDTTEVKHLSWYRHTRLVQAQRDDPENSGTTSRRKMENSRPKKIMRNEVNHYVTNKKKNGKKRKLGYERRPTHLKKL